MVSLAQCDSSPEVFRFSDDLPDTRSSSVGIHHQLVESNPCRAINLEVRLFSPEEYDAEQHSSPDTEPLLSPPTTNLEARFFSPEEYDAEQHSSPLEQRTS